MWIECGKNSDVIWYCESLCKRNPSHIVTHIVRRLWENVSGYEYPYSNWPHKLSLLLTYWYLWFLEYRTEVAKLKVGNMLLAGHANLDFSITKPWVSWENPEEHANCPCSTWGQSRQIDLAVHPQATFCST